MQFIATADFHAHNFKDFSSKKNRFEIQLQVLDQIIALAKKHNAAILFAGDLFHKRSFINVQVFNPLFTKIAQSGCQWIMIPGNHDEVSPGIHSLEPFASLPNVKLLYNSHYPTQGPDIIGVAPGQKVPSNLHLKNNIVLAHGMLNGAKNNFGFEFTGGYNVKDFEGAGLVILGDIHKGQQHGNVVIPGSCLSHDFGDAGDPKSVLLIKEDLSVERLPIKAPEFRIISASTLTAEQLEKGDDENYYRIDLAATATQKTERTLKEKFPNSVFTRQPAEKSKQRAKISATQDYNTLLATYHDYAKLPVDKQSFISVGCNLLATGTKGTVSSTQARTFTFKRIWAQNFMSYSKADYTFKEGTYLVTGGSDDVTADTNGIGKSTLFVDAILFCLYGTLARASVKSKDRVIHDPKHTGKGKNCAVGIELAIGSDNYEFIRARKHDKYGTSAVIIKNGQPLVFENPEDEVEKIIALPLEVLLNIAIFPQRTLKPNYKPFLVCTDTERKEVLEAALSLGAFGIAREQAEQMLKIAMQRKQLVEQDQALLLARRDAQQQMLTEVKDGMATFEANKKLNIENLEKQLADFNAKPVVFDEVEWNNVVTLLAQLNATLIQTSAVPLQQAKVQQLMIRLSGTEQALKATPNISAQVLTDEQVTQLNLDIETLSTAYTTGQATIAKFYKEAPQSQLAQLAALKLEEKEITDQTAAISTKIDKLKKEIARVQGEATATHDATVCHVCKQQVIGEAAALAKQHLASQVVTLQKQKEELALEFQSKIQKKDKIVQQIPVTEQLHAAHLAHIEIINGETAQNNQVRAKLEELKHQLAQDSKAKQSAQVYLTEAAKLKTTIELLQTELQTTQAELVTVIDEQQAKLQQLTVQLSAITGKKDQLEGQRKEYQQYRDLKKETESKLSHTRVNSYALTGALAAAESDMAKLHEQIATNQIALDVTCKPEVTLIESLITAFGSQGIVSLILDEFLSEFQRLTTELCNEITLGSLQIKYDTEVTLKKKDAAGNAMTRDKFDVIVEKTNGGEGDLVSGSEQQKCNLIIETALSRLVMSRSNVQVNLRVYDEVFDGLSAVSTEFVAKSLLTEEPGICKYIVSHRQELASIFDKQIEIEMKDGVSRLVNNA